MTETHSIRRALLALTLCLSTACVPDPDRLERRDAAYLRIVSAEDARPGGGRSLDLLIAATGEEDPFLRRAAVRALGRLERPTLADAIEPLLTDPAAIVRAEGAAALAQAHHGGNGAPALSVLAARMAVEEDPFVLGALAQSVGRLRLEDRDREAVANLLLNATRAGGEDAEPVTLLGVALGAEALVRGASGGGIGTPLARRLEELARYQGDFFPDPRATKVRVLALSALGQSRRIHGGLIERGLADDAPEVQATAARYLGVMPPDLRAEPLRRAAARPSPLPVVEALRFIAGEPRSAEMCRYLFAAAQPQAPGAPPPIATSVRVTALDALALPCPDVSTQRTLLVENARSVNESAADWQPAAHALLSLSVLDPDEAAGILPRFVGHDNPFVRMYGARAAGRLGSPGVLRVLLDDADANVRTAALEGLFTLEGRAIDGEVRRQLSQDDGQLLMTAARLLEGTAERRAAAEALADAFDRISSERLETRRDPRRAILNRLEEVGDESLTGRLVPYLSDYDPAIAADAADVLESWTGRSYFASPEPLPRAPLPTPAELRRMAGARVVLHMAGGGEIEIQLLPYTATTNVFRFFRLASEGGLDGLTFHRWAPNFVIQGGSPGANEYAGHGAYTRDEVGANHWRGTVGISTRGHDTGDGQIFVNLLDNMRLNHTYTVVGSVVRGMDVVDRVAEGSVIERAEVREAPVER